MLKIEEIIKIYKKKNYDKYYNNISADIGIMIKDYERHPDTKEIIADNSYYENQEEIKDNIIEDMADDILDSLLGEGSLICCYDTKEEQEQAEAEIRRDILKILRG